MTKRIVLAAGLVASLTGCSWLFMEHVDERYRPSQGEPRCTASGGWEAWDAVLALGHISVAGYSGYTAGHAAAGTPVDSTLVGIAVVDGLFAILHAASAFSGAAWADGCEKARHQRDEFNPAFEAEQRRMNREERERERERAQAAKKAFDQSELERYRAMNVDAGVDVVDAESK